jgi:thiamine-monophosphate kinase
MGRFAATTDALVEGVDFERAWAPPQAVGYKAMAANLSDLAAMGARPRHLLLTLGWPNTLEDTFVEGVLKGLQALCEAEGVGLCGGDLTRAPVFFLSLTLLGEQRHAPLLRSGGRPGDLLCVSGDLGGPAAALERFRAGERLGEFAAAAPPCEGSSRVLDRFYRPPSQTALGEFLAQRGLATCCMDLSDGLARDLGRLCEASRCGAELDAANLPLDGALLGLSPDRALDLALKGGEEQILLFAVEPARAVELDEAPGPVHRIGRLVPGGVLDLLVTGGGREALAFQGFDHFTP